MKRLCLVGLTVCVACSSDPEPANGGTAGSANAGGGAGVAGAVAMTAGQAGAFGSAGVANGSGGGGGVPSSGDAGAASVAGSSGAGGASGGASGAAGSGGSAGMMGIAGAGVNNVPGDYKGTPYAALKIPGSITACDYDRGGPDVAWCHQPGGCGANTVTGDYPANTGPYRTPLPADAKICSGAQCDDNVGVCRMNPKKPDNTINGQPMPADGSYLCYTTAGTWTKYTVTVAEAGTYSVGGVMAVPDKGAVNISFGNAITTGDIKLAITPTTNSGSGENYHSWDDRKDLGAVTFPAAGKYLMTVNQVGRFNAASFSFTKK